MPLPNNGGFGFGNLSPSRLLFLPKKKKDEECPIAKLTVYYDHNVSMPKEKAKGKTEKKVNRWKLSLKMSSSE